MDCINCDYWNRTSNYCEDALKWVDSESNDRVCRFREGAVMQLSTESFDTIKPKLKNIRHILKYLELECKLSDTCIDKVNTCIHGISDIVADISDHQQLER